MATLEFSLYQYTVVNGAVTEVSGLQTLTVDDKNGDGLLTQKELAAYFQEQGNGHLWGIGGTDPARPATFTVGDTGNLKDFTLFTTSLYEVGDKVDTSGLVQNFKPFDPHEAGVPCFSAATLIETARGPVAAGDLAVGDMVRTRDAGLQPIRWIGRRALDAAALERAPHLRPIRIRAGALGQGLPEADVLVSPQHRVLISSRIAERMFGERQILVAAKQLLLIDGIDVAGDVDFVEYFHLLFDRHQIIFAEGAPMESLFTGVEALKALSAAARREIFEILPELMQLNAETLPEPARQIQGGRTARKLAARHVQNQVPLLAN